MIKEFIINKFIQFPSYMESGAGRLAEYFKTDRETIYQARIDARIILSEMDKIDEYRSSHNDVSDTNRNVLVISDTHIPAEHKDALEALKEAYNDYNITDVVHIGDLADLHTVSYHETDRRSTGVDDEIELVRDAIKPWYDAFPDVTVCFGNHDLLIDRKSQSGNIPSQFIRPLNEVLGVPNWEFVDSLTVGKVFFTHGTGLGAKGRAKAMGISTVSGHAHSKKYIEYVDVNHNIFGMQTGCLVDKDTYNMAYAKHSIIALGFAVVLDVENDPQPILINL